MIKKGKWGKYIYDTHKEKVDKYKVKLNWTFEINSKEVQDKSTDKYPWFKFWFQLWN